MSFPVVHRADWMVGGTNFLWDGPSRPGAWLGRGHPRCPVPGEPAWCGGSTMTRPHLAVPVPCHGSVVPREVGRTSRSM